MPYLRDCVIILKKEPFREQDRRYVMYGKEHGLLVAMARGSSVRTSKQAGHLEPFSISDVMIAKGAAFDKLAVARLLQPFCGTRIAAFAVCGAAADLAIRLLRPGIVDERIFDLLNDLFRMTESLPRDPSPDRAQLLFAAVTLKFLDALGYAPRIGMAVSGSTSVPALAVASFLRRGSFLDILRLTGTTDVFASACAFVAQALEAAPLNREPHGRWSVAAIVD